MSDDLQHAAELLAQALDALGLRADDDEMGESPAAMASVLAEFRPRPTPALTPLDTESHELVVLRGLPFYSLCAHHMVPFFGTCDIAYRPDGRIAGLGAFPRLLEALARRPQLQERLTAAVADAIWSALDPRALLVRTRARQLCMEMRGARSPGTIDVIAERGVRDKALIAALGA